MLLSIIGGEECTMTKREKRKEELYTCKEQCDYRRAGGVAGKKAKCGHLELLTTRHRDRHRRKAEIEKTQQANQVKLAAGSMLVAAVVG
jgi:hypothetical protein